MTEVHSHINLTLKEFNTNVVLGLKVISMTPSCQNNGNSRANCHLRIRIFLEIILALNFCLFARLYEMETLQWGSSNVPTKGAVILVRMCLF